MPFALCLFLIQHLDCAAAVIPVVSLGLLPLQQPFVVIGGLDFDAVKGDENSGE